MDYLGSSDHISRVGPTEERSVAVAGCCARARDQIRSPRVLVRNGLRVKALSYRVCDCIATVCVSMCREGSDEAAGGHLVLPLCAPRVHYYVCCNGRAGASCGT